MTTEAQQPQVLSSYPLVDAKWGRAVSSGRRGFQVLPDVLLRSQRKLRLDAIDMVVLINILMHWWEPDDWPYPRPAVIAQRMGISARTVERHIQRLSDRGLLEWMPWESNGAGPSVRRFNLQGLIEKLQEVAFDADIDS